MAENIFQLVREFGEAVPGIMPPPTPTLLEPDQVAWAEAALTEEVQEFKDAKTVKDQADALIDLIYFAAGRLNEMGVDGYAHFMAVHGPNMNKEPGELSKRPGYRFHDAIKPEGWVGPDDAHEHILANTSFGDYYPGGGHG